ncbi:MAG: GGDEF domain-containing protein [Notoacmeibacter sp.]|nr:GGDEF domain-containing protein [Notoacmeibacter sp.]
MTSFDQDVAAINAELERPFTRLGLIPSLENEFRARTAPDRRRIVTYWFWLAIAVNLVALALDPVSEVFEHGLIARVGLVIPTFLLAMPLLNRGPEWLRATAVTVPWIMFVGASGFLAEHAHSLHVDRYYMVAGVVILFVNIAAPLHFRCAVFMTAASLASLIVAAVSHAGSPFLPSHDVSLISFVGITSAISLVIRYRSEWDARQMFLNGLRDDLKSAQLLALNNALGRLAETDPMTGLFNRRHMVKTLKEKWRDARERNDWLGILMIDIDRFKDFNDTAGHDEGDHCLNAVADRLNDEVHKTDQYVARFGGEEFMAVIEHLEPEPLMAEAERIRRSVEAMEIPHPGLGPRGRVTISIGAAATIPTPQSTVDDLMVAADKALYAAKAAGRNRVEGSAIAGPRQRRGIEREESAAERAATGSRRVRSRH